MKKSFIMYTMFGLTIILSSCKPFQRVTCGGPTIPADAHYNSGSGVYKKSAIAGVLPATLNNHEGAAGSCSFQCNDPAKIFDSNTNTCVLGTVTVVVPEFCDAVSTAANGWNTSGAVSYGGLKNGADVTACAIATCEANYAVNATTKSCGVTKAACDALIGGGYRFVARIDGYTDYDMCVAKYEAQKDIDQTGVLVSGKARSRSGIFSGVYPDIISSLSDAQRTPWTNVTRVEAKVACELNGPGYHLISNSEWQTTARQLSLTSNNWSSGVVGTDSMSPGHSDHYIWEPTLNPTLPAWGGGTEASNQTGCAYTATGISSNLCTDPGAQYRVFITPNAQSIWDFAGNAMEWVSDDEVSLSLLAEIDALIVAMNAPQGSVTVSGLTPSSPTINNTYGSGIACAIGNCGFGIFEWEYLINAIPSTRIRGGGLDWGTGSGIFSSLLGVPENIIHPTLGFRCVYSR